MTMQSKNFFFTTSLLLLLSSSLFADLLTQYRQNGIQGIEKQMDTNLAQKEYWSDYLKNIDTSFGYIESYTDVLSCNKSDHTLTLYIKDTNNSYKFRKKYSAFTGKMQGDKETEGDKRTPLGVYTLVKKLSHVDPFYGPMAFVTSYPNDYDKYRGKKGHGIWIHGVPKKEKRDSFTKGCIAINNANIKCLDRHINIEKTVLIIDKKEHRSPSKDTLSNILAQIYAWRYAWLYNDVDSYLNFYDSKFRRFDGMNLKNFKKYKTRIFGKKESKQIIFNNLNVIPYPESSDIFKVTFYEIYKSKSFTFNGSKTLIVKLDNSKIKIITEK